MSNFIKFQLQGQFQRFLNQTLCVFSQIKDIKFISDRIFIRLPWSCPMGGTGGCLGGRGRQFFFFLPEIQPNLVY